MVGVEAESQQIGRLDPGAGEREVNPGLIRTAGQVVAGTDIGKQPDPRLGMAKSVRSVTTRMRAGAETPTPPPMVMPSASAMYGLR